MPAKRYQWNKWFRESRFTLVRGRDYYCSQSSMCQQIRNAAGVRGLAVNLFDHESKIVVFVENGVKKSRIIKLTKEEAESLVERITGSVTFVGDCWKGPNQITIKKSGQVVSLKTNRLVYVLWNNEPPIENYQLSASCGNRGWCLNPEHLILGDRQGTSCAGGGGYNQIVLEDE